MDLASPDSLLQVVLDAMPSMVFLVDERLAIRGLNAAAAGLMDPEREELLSRRAGDVLRCLNAQATPGGCGASADCRRCVIRNSALEATQGRRVVRRRTRMELTQGGERHDFYALVTASPFQYQGRPHVLLSVEDISELAEIQRLLPICCVCKKIRSDSESWVKIESYFKSVWNVDFSHSYCPDCLVQERERLLHEHDEVCAHNPALCDTNLRTAAHAPPHASR